MGRRIMFLAVAALSLALVLPAMASASSSASASASASAKSPRVLDCAGRAVIRPGSYVLSCADANAYFDDIHWTSWDATAAVASATFVENTCTPTCAGGHFVKHPARLALSDPRVTRHGRLFSEIRYRYTVSTRSSLPIEPLSTAATSR
ncbi:MAG: hypothetical protein ACRDWE_06320 [Acidimicrobiales bacterium]